jgi:hypothetical protein
VGTSVVKEVAVAVSTGAVVAVSVGGVNSCVLVSVDVGITT